MVLDSRMDKQLALWGKAMVKQLTGLGVSPSISAREMLIVSLYMISLLPR